jgi:hypothetical protein
MFNRRDFYVCVFECSGYTSGRSKTTSASGDSASV